MTEQEIYIECLKIIIGGKDISIPFLQRKFKIEYKLAKEIYERVYKEK